MSRHLDRHAPETAPGDTFGERCKLGRSTVPAVDQDDQRAFAPAPGNFTVVIGKPGCPLQGCFLRWRNGRPLRPFRHGENKVNSNPGRHEPDQSCCDSCVHDPRRPWYLVVIGMAMRPATQTGAFAHSAHHKADANDGENMFKNIFRHCFREDKGRRFRAGCGQSAREPGRTSRMPLKRHRNDLLARRAGKQR